jgi:phosphocarrier protein HPr
MPDEEAAGRRPPAPDVLERMATIVNQRGLHARAAARFVREAERFNAVIEVANGDVAVTGTSIMGLMMLAAGTGTEIRLTARGAEATAALDALTRLVADGFDED